MKYHILVEDFRVSLEKGKQERRQVEVTSSTKTSQPSKLSFKKSKQIGVDKKLRKR